MQKAKKGSQRKVRSGVREKGLTLASSLVAGDVLGRKGREAVLAFAHAARVADGRPVRGKVVALEALFSDSAGVAVPTEDMDRKCQLTLTKGRRIGLKSEEN
jgi:hypothetical protein